MELAILSHTAPRDWWDEPMEVIATAYDVMLEHVKRAKEQERRHGR